MSTNLPGRPRLEALDIVDACGEPTGQIFDKQTVHEQGLRHRDVHVWITNGRDLLQQQRHQDKSIMPGAWDISVGGHVGAGESYVDAAIRESREELGLTISRGRLVRLGRVATQLMLPGWKQAHNIVGDNFAVLVPDLALHELQPQEEEIQDLRWYPIAGLAADLCQPETALRHAPQPPVLYALGIAGLRGLLAER